MPPGASSAPLQTGDYIAFFIKHIAAETAYVLKLLKVVLAQFIHLTLSFDGWSSKGGDKIYTVHITTPNRMSFLVEGLVLTGISTSGENIFHRLLAVLTLYVATNFSLVVSDTTKNVKCRALICAKYPWILNCPDPCHQLNLLAKDLVLGSKTWPKIWAFSQVMVIVNALTNYFSHSNYGKHHLKDAMKDAQDRRGIEAGGATRFSTFAAHSSSVLRCLPFMEQCFASGKIPFDTEGVHSVSRTYTTVLSATWVPGGKP
ncbi:hypothetical protein B0H13DRAFT_1855993 [Mycena leptocephala]|nr:hypothetical protein B0H13DRAFT_1855993 [Mycena leptocephala]